MNSTGKVGMGNVHRVKGGRGKKAKSQMPKTEKLRRSNIILLNRNTEIDTEGLTHRSSK